MWEQHSLESSEEECSQLRAAFEALQQEHGKISSKVVAGKDEVDALQKRLLEAQNEYSTEMSLLTADKETLLNRYSQLCDEADNLRAKLENMELDLAEGGHSRNVFFVWFWRALILSTSCVSDSMLTESGKGGKIRG